MITTIDIILSVIAFATFLGVVVPMANEMIEMAKNADRN